METNTVLSPTAKAERFRSMDTIRGVALLGILLMNIVGFGLVNAYSDPTNSGGATGYNLNVWWMNAMFFEGTMRGMFSMLFGAGVILFTSRAENAGSGVSVTDAYFRRILWLVLFGIIHSYFLLWHGEILYPYALCGLFAFSFRNWNPKKLIIGALVLCALTTAEYTKDYVVMRKQSDAAQVAHAHKDAGGALSKTDEKAIEEWEGVVSDRKTTPETIAKKKAMMHEGYWSIVWNKAPVSEFMQTTYMYRFFFFDILAMMLIGMAFFKNGIFKAERSNAYYGMMILIGYAIGLTTNFLEARHILSNEFSVLSFSLTDISAELGRVFTTVGHIGVIMLFIKSGILMWLQRALASVGQMAFSNYIMQSLICNFIFLGYGFSLYGELQRYQLYYIVGGIWILQLILSPLWLKYFHFGPLEWGWRSLTYWQKQPFRKQ